jgi:hypothetical protein
VKIKNRNDKGKRLCGFQIRIGDSVENNGNTNMRCGTEQHIPTNQVKFNLLQGKLPEFQKLELNMYSPDC